MNSNQMLYAEPLKVHMRNHEFRTRDVKKEIQPKMRFTAKTDLERVKDQIKRSAEIAEIISSKKKTKRIMERRSSINTVEDEELFFTLGSSNDQELKDKELDSKIQPTKPLYSRSKELAKSLRADLHLKTHFHTVSSIYNGQWKLLENTNQQDNITNHQLLEETIQNNISNHSPAEVLGVLNRCKSMDGSLMNNLDQDIPKKFLKRGKNEDPDSPFLIDSGNPLRRSSMVEEFKPDVFKYLISINKHINFIRRDAWLEKKRVKHEDNIRSGISTLCSFESKGVKSQRKEKVVKCEEIAGKVLSLCNMKTSRGIRTPQVLRKGEGHLMIGFGNNNKVLESMSNMGRESPPQGPPGGFRRRVKSRIESPKKRNDIERIQSQRELSSRQKVGDFLQRAIPSNKYQLGISRLLGIPQFSPTK